MVEGNAVLAASGSVETIGLGTHRYKAAFQKVALTQAAAFQQGGAACMLGVSLGNDHFEGARLEASVEWISERFDRCALVIGDSVYRLTLRLLLGLSESEARDRALAAGRAFQRAYAPLLAQYGGRCRFEFIPFSAVETQPGFAAYHDRLKALADDDAAFARSIAAFADLYLGRGDKLESHPFVVDAATAAAIAKAYLIEEAALFCCLEEMGWPLLVYPGSIDSIADLCEGRFAGTPAPLTRLAFLSLELIKRGLYLGDGAAKVIRSATGGAAADLPAESFLADASDAEWNQLLKFTKPKRFAPRETVVSADDAGRQLFLLTSGRAEAPLR